MWIFISLLAILVGAAVHFVKNFYSYWERRGVLYEEPKFPLGNAQGIGKTLHFRDIHNRIYKRFKGKAPFVGFFFLLKKSAILLDLELIKHVMIKDFSYFQDRGVYSNVEDEPLSGHLFGLDGEEWRSMRHKLSPVFTSGKMKFMFPTIVDVSNRLIEACDKLIGKEKNVSMDLKDLCARFTTDVIGTCAFGLECNSLNNPNAEFRRKGKEIFESPRHSAFIQFLIFTNPALARKLHMKFFKDDVSEFFINTVRSTIEYRTKNNVKRNDFINMLIEMKAVDEEAARKGKGIDLSNGLTLEQIAAQVFLFFVAGFDTSSTTMSFCLYELALNQDIQDKLRNEIMSVLGKYNGEFNYEAMLEMTYLDQVLSETLRKYSVLPHLSRVAMHDYKVPNSDLIIEAGTSIMIPVSALQYDPEYFPDPEKFDPSRFEPEEVAKIPQMAYIPFGDGPRNCIGLRFGKMQAKVGLVNLLRHYKFLKSTRTEIPIELDARSFIIVPKNGIHLAVQKL